MLSIHGQGLLVEASTVFSMLKSVAPLSAEALKDVNGAYQRVSREFEILFERPEGTVVGKSDHALFAIDVADRLKRSDQQVCATHRVVEEVVCVPLERRSVRSLWIKYPVFNPAGSLVAIGIVVVESLPYDDADDVVCSVDQIVKRDSQLKMELARLGREVGTDRLTGTSNRRRLEEVVLVEIERFMRYGRQLCLMIIDIDHFKTVNDECGHVAGDEVLVTFAQTISAALRATDYLARWGGDEFVVLSPETSLAAMSLLAERLRIAVSNTRFPHDKSVTVSIGVAECLRDEEFGAWFLRADQALYRAKDQGRNQVQCSNEAKEQTDQDKVVPVGFSDLVWHTAYECGHPVIDAQHRALFFSVNGLLLDILNGDPDREIGLAIDRLACQAAEHFRNEEEILASAGFSGLGEHAAKHSGLIESAENIVARFHSGTAHVGEVFVFMAHDLVAKHLMADDLDFFPLIRSAFPDVGE